MHCGNVVVVVPQLLFPAVVVVVGVAIGAVLSGSSMTSLSNQHGKWVTRHWLLEVDIERERETARARESERERGRMATVAYANAFCVFQLSVAYRSLVWRMRD